MRRPANPLMERDIHGQKPVVVERSAIVAAQYLLQGRQLMLLTAMGREPAARRLDHYPALGDLFQRQAIELHQQVDRLFHLLDEARAIGPRHKRAAARSTD